MKLIMKKLSGLLQKISRKRFLFSVFVLLLIGVYSCIPKKEQKSKINSLELINNFYQKKAEYLGSTKEKKMLYKTEFDEAWDSIIHYKEDVVRFLIGLKNDSTYTLYGMNYPKNFRFTFCHLPNNLHSLYLIEAIMVNDYLFNRRFGVEENPYIHYNNDGLNIVVSKYDRNEIMKNKDSLIHTCMYKNYLHNLDEVWDIYSSWYHKKFKVGVDTSISPLEGTEFSWINMYALVYGKYNS